MKIGMITNYWLPHIGGIELYTYEVAKRLIQTGYQVEILTAMQNNCSKKEIIEGISVTRIDSINYLEKIGVPYPIFYPSVFKEIKEFVIRCDLIHGHGHPYFSSFLGSKYSNKYKKPFVLTIHN